MGKLLTEDRKHVEILTHIRIDKSLPKYRLMAAATEGKTDIPANRVSYSTPEGSTNDIKENTALSYENLKKFLNEKTGGITDFNVSVTKTINDVLDRTTMNGIWTVDGVASNARKKETLFSVLKKHFSKQKQEKEEENKIKRFDVAKFFSEVHGLADEEESTKYINRIAEYIECIGYTETTGQVALKEKLIKNLVVNKLESILYSKGMYRAIDENVIVQLAYNAPKPLCLDYIENYVRNIPIDVIKKKIEADKLEVFDNYCVLHYDETGESYAKTDKQKEKEVQKRKDPILFGLINGSTKLYFVADWVDELCDLTFDKVTEIVGKEIVEKGFLKEKIQ